MSKRKEARYEVSDAVLKSVGVLDSSNSPIPRGLMGFAKNLIECYEQHGSDGFITTTQLKEFLLIKANERDVKNGAPTGSSSSMVSTYIKQLKNSGAIKERLWSDERTRVRIKVFRLESLEALVAFFTLQKHRDDASSTRTKPGRPTKREESQQLDLLLENGLAVISASTALQARTDKLFGLMSGALRSGRGDTRKVVNARYLLGREHFDITAKTESGDSDEIPDFLDIRFVHALTMAAHDYFRRRQWTTDKADGVGDILEDREFQQRVAAQPFVIDVYRECSHMYSSSHRENRIEYLKTFRRWASTTFYVNAKNSSLFRTWFMPNGAEVGSYRLIQQYWAAFDPDDPATSVDTNGKDVSLVDERTRYIALRMDPTFLLDAMHSNFGFLIHPEIARDSSGLIQRLYIWIKAIITFRDNERHPFTFYELYKRAFPGTENFGNLRRDLLAQAKRRCDAAAKDNAHVECTGFWQDIYNGGSNVFWVYGFYIQVEINPTRSEELRRMRPAFADRVGGKDQDVVWTIWRDREDAIVGDNSPAALAARNQRRKELEISNVSIPHLDRDVSG